MRQSEAPPARSDDQLENRFEPFLLPPWEDGPELGRLLASFEAVLPLNEPSGLGQGVSIVNPAQIRDFARTKIRGQWHYPCRAIDKYGMLPDPPKCFAQD